MGISCRVRVSMIAHMQVGVLLCFIAVSQSAPATISTPEGANNQFDDSQFWFSYKLEDVDWRAVMRLNLPSLSQNDEHIVLGVCGRHSINPLIPITALKLDMEHFSDSSSSSNSTTDLNRDKIYEWTKNLASDYEHFEANSNGSNPSTLAIESGLSSIDGTIESFFAIYNVMLLQELITSANPFSMEKFVQDIQSFSFDLPYPVGKGYFVGGTHSQNSALDMYDGKWGCNGWGKRGCNAIVTAAHSGRVNVLADCDVHVKHSTGYRTSYYHMENMLSSGMHGKFVNAGDVLGRYAKDYKMAICAGGRSSGPHVHFSLMDRSGRPKSLDGWMMGTYKIKAGRVEYDRNCNRCNFKDITTGEVYCPYKKKLPHRSQESTYTKVTKSSCKDKYKSYSTLESAIQACSSDSSCGGVYKRGCDIQRSIKLCKVGTFRPSRSSCTYRKP